MATNRPRRSPTRSDDAGTDETKPARSTANTAKRGTSGKGASAGNKAPAGKKAPVGKKTSAAKVGDGDSSSARRSVSKQASASSGTARKKTGGSRTQTSSTKASSAKTSSTKASSAKRTPTHDEKSTVSTKSPVTGRTPATSKRADAKATATKLAVRDDESPWTAAELEEQTATLTAESDRLRTEITEAQAELEDLLIDTADSSGDDTADAGGKNFDREHELSLANNTRDMLVQVERALDRIANGSYGSCESCGNPIGKARLQAFPRATLCVPCKQREERR